MGIPGRRRQTVVNRHYSVVPCVWAGLAWLASLLLVPQALAQDFIVQSTADVADANPGDGNCAASDRAALDLGLCTLRAAIQEANALGGVHTITLPPGTYKLTIPSGGGFESDAAVGDLDVVGSDVRIYGAGERDTIIDGNKFDHVFEVFSNGRLELCDVTILNGKANGGGGILNLGAVKVCNSTIQSNFSQNSGGGIANLEGAEMVIRDSTISGNSAVGGGGGIMNGGKLTITRTKVTGNIAGPKESGGGVINLPGGSLTITDSTISGNSAGMGGGVLNNGTAIMRRSTVSGNTAHDGAGLANLSQFSITNSTISGNQFSSNQIESSAACSGFDPCIGGGIFNSASGGLEIVNTTINNNHGTCILDENGNNCLEEGGGITNQGNLTIRNSIVSNNLPGNCFLFVKALTSLGHNLESDNSCGFNAVGDLVNTDPHLGPLADNGGPTRTHALLLTSKAINGATSCPNLDQRRASRPVPSQCDIGAYEKVRSYDLSVAMTDNCDTVRLGGLLTYLITATNFSPGAAANVVLSDALPQGLQFVSARASQGSCHTIPGLRGGTTVICDVGTIPPDDSVQLTVLATPLVAGSLTNIGIVASPMRESNPRNNLVRVTTTVLAPGR